MSNNRKSFMKGVLEIDHDKGKILFHSTDPNIIAEAGTPTILTLTGLTTPIPEREVIFLKLREGTPWKHKDTEEKTEVLYRKAFLHSPEQWVNYSHPTPKLDSLVEKSGLTPWHYIQKLTLSGEWIPILRWDEESSKWSKYIDRKNCYVRALHHGDNVWEWKSNPTLDLQELVDLKNGSFGECLIKINPKGNPSALYLWSIDTDNWTEFKRD